MPKGLNKFSAEKSNQILKTIVENPGLIEAVQNLDAPTFVKIISHIGLEDSLPLVSLINSNQIIKILNEDLWKMQPGKAEEFQAQRFSLWLTILSELGEREFLEFCQQLDEDFLVFALSEVITVFNLDDLMLNIESYREGGGADKSIQLALEAVNSFEIDSYLFLDKGSEYWESIVQLIAILDTSDRHLLDRVCDRLVDISSDLLADMDELSEVLNTAQTLAEDVRDERASIRASEGFVDPQEAKSYFRLMEKQSLDEIMSEDKDDYFVRSYFRKYDASKSSSVAISSQLMQLLEEYNLVEPLGDKKALGSSSILGRKFRSHLESQSQLSHSEMADINSRLTFLANVVLVGVPRRDGNLTPIESSNFVFKYCEQGLEFVRQSHPQLDSDQILREFGVVKLFKLGLKTNS